MVKVNGTDVDAGGRTLAEYLIGTSYEVKYIAVERNGEIVPKSYYDNTILADGDVIEVVCFVGGG